jgi:hypothetical protein
VHHPGGGLSNLIEAIMKTVNISPDEASVFETFREGHPVQVRVSVSPGDEREYDKGQRVRVIFEQQETEAKIVSEPIEIQAKAEGGKKTFSLVLEKP